MKSIVYIMIACLMTLLLNSATGTDEVQVDPCKVVRDEIKSLSDENRELAEENDMAKKDRAFCQDQDCRDQYDKLIKQNKETIDANNKRIKQLKEDLKAAGCGKN